ncbi:MAG: DUF3352 domain-containing protein [Candidatus Limnocylindria bacterium]
MHRLVVALTALLAISGAAVVAFTLVVAGATVDRAAALAPADTAVYANVYLQPSSGQRARLAALAGRLPGFADAASLDDKIDQVTQNLLSQLGIDYRDRVKPWLGTQVAFAADAAELTAAEPAGVALVAVRDQAAAEAALADLLPEADAAAYRGVDLHVGVEATYALLEEMLVVGTTRPAVEAVVDVSRGAPALADAAAFRDAIATLPPDRMGTLYVDLIALAGLADELGSGLSVLSAAIVLEEDGVRLVGSAPFDAAAASESARAAFGLAGEPSSLVEWMPADTQAEVVVFGARQALGVAESAAAGTAQGQTLTDALSAIRTLAAFGLGIDLDDEVLPLFDRELAVAVSAVDTSAPHGLLLARPEDGEAAAALLDRLTQRLEDSGAQVTTQDAGRAEITIIDLPALETVAYTLVDGIVVAALEAADVEAAIAAHDSGDTLAATDAYANAFALAGERAGNEAWLDVAALVSATGLADGLVPDARDMLGQITALGLTAPSRDNAIQIRAAVTVE